MQDTIKNHQEIVTLVFQHIEELEVLEKKRYNDKVANDRSALFAGAAPVKIGRMNVRGRSGGTDEGLRPWLTQCCQTSPWIEMTQFNGRPAAPTQSQLPDIDEGDPETARDLAMLQEGNRDIVGKSVVSISPLLLH